LPFLCAALLIAAGRVNAQSNMVLLMSPVGEYIGQGKTSYTTNLADFNATFYPGPLPAAVQTTAFGYMMIFAGPNGVPPVVGTYSNAVRYPLEGSNPGISISGNGRGCNSICGNFQVFEMETNGSGNLTRFWATFSQRCECSGAPLTGEIRFHSALAPPTPLPRTLRVPADYATIQAAVNIANQLSFDQVLVDPGVYEESVQLAGRRVQLVSSSGPKATYITATGGVAVAVGGATPDTLISGFTLMDSITGISISAGGSPTITSNAIVDCGTGIVCDSGSIDSPGSPTIRGNNITGSSGNAIQLSFTGVPLIEANDLEDNGGGIGMWQAGNPTIRNNIFRRNRGDAFSMVNYSDANIIQNLIVENGGAGVNYQAPQNARGPWIINNTIAGNKGPGIAAGTFSDGVQIINNIVVGSPAISVGNPPPVIQFNNFFSRNGPVFAGITNQTGLAGNISAEPFFICEPGGNYRLLPASPCLDAGTNGATLLPASDFDGLTRVLPATTNAPARVDIGAFEYNFTNAATNPCLFLHCPANVVVATAPGSNTAVVNFGASFATPGAAVTNSPPSGSVFPEGTNTVTSTATYGTNVLRCSFTVTVIVPPTILSQPQGLAVSAGTTTNLSVAAQGSSPVGYQWSFENTPIPGATNATLLLTNLQANNEGFYRVVVTNAAGSATSAAALVRVLPAAPTIDSGPSPLAVAAGSNATFQVATRGSNPLSFQWFHDGTPFPPVTSAQLVVSNAQQADGGTYYVVVSNALGTVTSASVSLVVTSSPPRFVVQPAGPPSGFLFAGSSFTLNAVARGSEPIAYQWRRSNTNLPGMTNSSLALSNVTSASNGSYSVMASNAFGSATSVSVAISVLGSPPVFTQQPASIEVLEGSTVTLNSLASGTTPLSYQWKFYGTNLPGQTNRQLTLTSVTLAQAGPYYVTASNSVGSTNSAVAQLTVNQSVIITQPLTNQVVNLGATVSLALGVSSTGPVNYSWQFNGQPIPGTNSVLVLSNVQPAQSGFYRVTVANQYGSLDSTGRVSVFGPPSAVIAWGDNSAGQIGGLSNLNDVVAIAGGDYHTLALRRSGTLVAWGYNGNEQTNIPTIQLRFVSIAAGAEHNLAITEAGDVVAWGRNDSGQCNVPATVGPAVSVAAGDAHSITLRASGTVAAWGDNSLGQTSVPFGLSNVRAIAAGRQHNLALLNSGAVAGWGLNTYGQATPPPGLNDVSAIAAGYVHSVALRSNGVVVAWGDNSYQQTNVPPQLTNVIAIAAGDYHTLALSADGKVTSWGNNWFGQTNVPPASAGSWAVASGYYDSFALSSPPMLRASLVLNQLVIEWSGLGTLQWSSSPMGPYEDIPGVSGSYTNSDFSLPAKFFRLKR
jgi:parallel beta-helix repeat protein